MLLSYSLNYRVPCCSSHLQFSYLNSPKSPIILKFPQYHPEGKLVMTFSQPGGRDFKIVLEDSGYEVIWVGRVANQHGGRAIHCYSCGGVIKV